MSRRVLVVAHGILRLLDLPPLGAAAAAAIEQLLGQAPTPGKVRAAIERLRRAGLVAKTGSRGVVVADTLFAEFVKTKTLAELS